MTWKRWFLLFILLNAFDCHGTLLVLRAFGPECEIMPWARMVFAKWDAAGMIALKIVFLFLYYCLVRLLFRLAPPEIAPEAISWGLGIACGLLFFVVILNYFNAFFY